MAQDIQSILQQLDAGYNPQRQAINDQIAQLQPQADAQIQGLKQQQTNAFGDITNAARDRGMGFSGIPIDEQAKYTGGTFLPAVANVQKSVNDNKNSLLGSLNNLGLDQYKTAYSVQQNQQDLEEKQREFDQQLAAQKAASAASNASMASMLGGGVGYGGSTASTPAAVAQQRQNGGYNFADASGNAISAAKYAQLTGKSIGSVLQQMGGSGDKYAQQLYNQLKNDPFYGKGNATYDNKIKSTYSPIFWGA